MAATATALCHSAVFKASAVLVSLGFSLWPNLFLSKSPLKPSRPHWELPLLPLHL